MALSQRSTSGRSPQGGPAFRSTSRDVRGTTTVDEATGPRRELALDFLRGGSAMALGPVTLRRADDPATVEGTCTPVTGIGEKRRAPERVFSPAGNRTACSVRLSPFVASTG